MSGSRSAVARRTLGRARGYATLLAIALVLVACGDDRLHVGDAPEPHAVPPEEAELFDGGWAEVAAWVRRANAEGRPVVVNVFASWCDPCRRELPLLLDAVDDNPYIGFLGVDHLDQRQAAEQFVEDMGINFPTIYDVAGDFAVAVHARGMPTTVVFDVDGALVAHHTGELTGRSLEALLDEVR